MAPSRIELHPGAAAEAQAAAQWYESRNPEAARAFLNELDVAIERIADAPGLWPISHHGVRQYLMRRFPYVVVYRETQSSIEIVAVAHGRRRPGYWKSQTMDDTTPSEKD
jgi:plasmid stabilization system protein ParE